MRTRGNSENRNRVNKQRSHEGGRRSRNSNSNSRSSSSSNSSGGYQGGRREEGSEGGSYNGNFKRKRYSSKPRRKFKQQKIRHNMYIAKAANTPHQVSYIPENAFNDFEISQILKENVFAKDYVNPTKIQDQTIPEILKGKDILGIASTGSGKTAAFLLPMINKAIYNRKQKCLIVTPTRELASQIRTEFDSFAQNTGLRAAVVVGGSNIGKQIRILKKQPNFVIATPGRLLDLKQRKVIDLSKFNNVILDEVDQMLDMGFLEDIKKIVDGLAKTRQSLFFSATMSPKEEIIANSLLTNPFKIQTEKIAPILNVDQDIVKIHNKAEKMDILHSLVKRKDFKKVLIFSKTRRGTDVISKVLKERGINSDALHGDKSQRERSKVLKLFRTDVIEVLVATDVASRGIDVKDITHVINYDEPASYKDYIHRVGRTGRAGKRGSALTFVYAKR